MSRDIPDGVADAAPAAGWESADVADETTSERSDAETVEAGLPSDRPTGHEAEAVDEVESAEVTQGIDPDLATDAGAEDAR